jgi:hypothetical protein
MFLTVHDKLTCEVSSLLPSSFSSSTSVSVKAMGFTERRVFNRASNVCILESQGEDDDSSIDNSEIPEASRSDTPLSTP